MKRLTIIIGLLAAYAGWVGAQTAQAPSAQVRVATIPDGAMVVCDGVLKDVSPITIPDLGAGDHLLVLKKPGYLDSRYTVNLSANQKAAVEIKLEPVRGLILVRTTPEGADIQVEGADRGKTPLLLTDLPIGKYRLSAAANGFVSKSVEVTVETRTPQLVKIDLASDSATLRVNSTPTGATVVVNGLTKGVTPCSVERILAGESTVSVTLEGYTPFVQKVKLQAGDEQTIDTPLSPLPASLSVFSAPEGARVLINDELAGKTPLVLDAVAPGSYAVRVESPGFAPESRTIELKRQERRTEEFLLVRILGTLEVLTDQVGAKVMVDGKDCGSMSSGEGRATAPLRIDLPVGDHRMVLSKKGFATIEKSFKIKQGEVVSFREAMKRSFVADTVVRLRSGDVLAGYLSRKLPGGDVELETKIGIFKTVKAQDILAIDPVAAEETK